MLIDSIQDLQEVQVHSVFNVGEKIRYVASLTFSRFGAEKLTILSQIFDTKTEAEEWAIPFRIMKNIGGESE